MAIKHLPRALLNMVVDDPHAGLPKAVKSSAPSSADAKAIVKARRKHRQTTYLTAPKNVKFLAEFAGGGRTCYGGKTSFATKPCNRTTHGARDKTAQNASTQQLAAGSLSHLPLEAEYEEGPFEGELTAEEKRFMAEVVAKTLEILASESPNKYGDFPQLAAVGGPSSSSGWVPPPPPLTLSDGGKDKTAGLGLECNGSFGIANDGVSKNNELKRMMDDAYHLYSIH